MPGTPSPRGYVYAWYTGKHRLAHRVSWELHNGPIPDGMLVCHHCDNRACVRPGHLFLGTAADNSADMIRKGRARRGETHHTAKLSEADVIAIRRMRASGETQQAVADRFGIALTTVRKIHLRLTWSHL